MSNRKQIILAAALVVMAIIVVAVVGLCGGDSTGGETAQDHDRAAMARGDGAEQLPVRLDAASAARIGVTYAAVVRKPLDRTVKTVALVQYDETRVVNVNPKIEGWVERLYVDFTGAPVTRGQPLLDLYSPMLVSAQEELILARRLIDEIADDPESDAARRARQLYEASRRRLAYWDIPVDQINRIERGGEPRKTLTLRAPASGIVLEKNVVEGTRVMPGMDIYRIVDLSTIWIEGEVFEKDLSLVHVGQAARVTFDAYPGQTFGGPVTYVYPTVSLDARTGRIRVELANPGLRLKPGMYGAITLDASSAAVLVVPRTAIHDTGERSYVFVRGDDDMLVAREVTTGLVAGNEIEILSGLEEGNTVVSSANFLIDAESSMGSAIGAMSGMEMGGEASEADHEIPATKEE